MIWKEAVFPLFRKMCSVDLTNIKVVEFLVVLDTCSQVRSEYVMIICEDMVLELGTIY